ncbi:hypothetical protein AF332_00240 [Sporosarcina globispora]|uniref:DUF1036 domain-containing protein n=1 Tax=Sporosarcina globispora TaxID=1459 RepID=A0A0M0G6J0_SPOGL|nr:DUF1036 domain-containing protein [Sporosarcina globispora]KON85454.1 hypothetical protein AF332_00240 [Sporosarcina globispora]
MGLYFKNTTNETLQVVISYPKDNCSGGYAVKGWWILAPGQEKKAWSGWAGKQRFYYYAESQSSERFWPRDGNSPTAVQTYAFDTCEDDVLCVALTTAHPGAGGDTGCRTVYMGEINPSWEVMDYTVKF